MNWKFEDNAMQLPTWLLDSRSMVNVYHIVLVGVALLALVAIFCGAAATTGSTPAGNGDVARDGVMYVLMFVLAFGGVLLLSAPSQLGKKQAPVPPVANTRAQRRPRGRRALHAFAKS